MSAEILHLLYRTTCIPTGKFYVGMHSTANIDDGYFGSGIIVSRSIKKYGADNHTREIISYHSSREELAEAEKNFITKDLREDKQCMNIGIGGNGNAPGFKHPAETRLKLSNSSKAAHEKRKKLGLKPPKQTQETIQKRVASNTGKKRTQEMKDRNSIISKQRHADPVFKQKFKEKVKAGIKAMSVDDKNMMLQNQVNAWKLRPPMSAAQKEKCAAFQRGRKHTIETKQRMSETKKKNTYIDKVPKKRLARTWLIEHDSCGKFKIENLKKFCIQNQVPNIKDVQNHSKWKICK